MSEEKTGDIKIGDVVRHVTCLLPRMAVDDIVAGRATCKWFDDTSPRSETFNLACLVKLK